MRTESPPPTQFSVLITHLLTRPSVLIGLFFSTQSSVLVPQSCECRPKPRGDLRRRVGDTADLTFFTVGLNLDEQERGAGLGKELLRSR